MCASRRQATTNGNSSGYAVGLVSPPNVIFNNAAQDATIAAVSPVQTLSLCSFYGTPGYAQASPLSFNVFGELAWRTYVDDVIPLTAPFSRAA